MLRFTSREAVSHSMHALFTTWRDTVAGDQLDWSSAMRVHADAAHNIRLNQMVFGFKC